jgi:hypothetical protein
MQHIQLVHREKIDVLLDFSDSEEMACDVEHRSAPGESRLIHDRECGYWPDAACDTNLRFDVHRQELSDCLYPTKESSRCAGDQPYRIGGHSEPVALFPE